MRYALNWTKVSCRVIKKIKENDSYTLYLCQYLRGSDTFILQVHKARKHLSECSKGDYLIIEGYLITNKVMVNKDCYGYMLKGIRFEKIDAKRARVFKNTHEVVVNVKDGKCETVVSHLDIKSIKINNFKEKEGLYYLETSILGNYSDIDLLVELKPRKIVSLE